MKTSKLTLAGAGLLLLATPAFAGHSMPAEREATRQLNLEAARQGQNSNQASAPQTQFAVADASANTAPITDAPVMSPRLRDRLSMPEMTPRWSGRTSIMTAVLLAAWNS